MRIETILSNNLKLINTANPEIKGIAYDSRMVKPNDIFVALLGENFDGHMFISDAIEKGAVAIVCERGKYDTELIKRYPHIAWFEAENSREALAQVSSIFYGNPSAFLTLIGITGTNGKTTTSYIIKHILESYGNEVGLIGTLGYLIKNTFYDAIHTTPEAPEFQYYLRRMLDERCKYAISEVSSHALAQMRADYSNFKIAVFTNLTQDHLDFHKTMESYYRAKKRLFTELLIDGGTAIINIDDFYGKRLLSELKTQRGDTIKYLTISIKNLDADLRALDIDISFDGVSFELKTFMNGQKSSINISSTILGIPNIYNLLTGIAVALALDIPLQSIKKAISEFKAIEGRFQKIDVGQDFLAIVDYAHTDDALMGILNTARELIKSDSRKSNRHSGNSQLNNGRIITVFGCGGNRDITKRPKMAQVATELSDYVIMTTDNPRFEDPMDIIKDMERGAKNSNYMIIPDRRLAIQMATAMASKGDMVVLAGKGHESYQEIKGIRYPFSDKLELENAIRMRK